MLRSAWIFIGNRLEGARDAFSFNSFFSENRLVQLTSDAAPGDVLVYNVGLEVPMNKMRRWQFVVSAPRYAVEEKKYRSCSLNEHNKTKH